MQRIIAWVAIIAMAAVPVQAFGHESIQTDSTWHQEPRVVDAQWNRFGFDVTSVAEQNHTEVIGLDFDATAYTLNITIKDTDEDGSVTVEEWMVMHLDALVEFQDLDGDGTYSLGDPTLHRTDLTAGNAANIRGLDIGPGYDMIISKSLRAPTGGSLTWTIHALQGGPHPAWFDSTMALEGYRFQNEGAVDLAVEVRVERGTPLEDGVVGAVAKDHTLFWSWEPMAASPTQSYPVLPTTVFYPPNGDEPESLVLLGHGQNGTFSHNMTMGAIRDVPDGNLRALVGDWKTYAIGLVVAGAVIGLSIRYTTRGSGGVQ